MTQNKVAVTGTVVAALALGLFVYMNNQMGPALRGDILGGDAGAGDTTGTPDGGGMSEPSEPGDGGGMSEPSEPGDGNVTGNAGGETGDSGGDSGGANPPLPPPPPPMCPDTLRPLSKVKGSRTESAPKNLFTSAQTRDTALGHARTSAQGFCTNDSGAAPAGPCVPATTCETDTTKGTNGVAGVLGAERITKNNDKSNTTHWIWEVEVERDCTATRYCKQKSEWCQNLARDACVVATSAAVCRGTARYPTEQACKDANGF